MNLCMCRERERGREYEEHWQRQKCPVSSNDDDISVCVCLWVLKLKYFSVKLYGNYDRNQWRKNTQQNKKYIKWRNTKRGNNHV